MQDTKSNPQTNHIPPVSASFVERGASAPLSFRGRLLLGKHDNARKSLARLTREYAAGNLDGAMYRNLVYGFSVMLNYYKHETETEILKRLEALEQQLEAGK